MIRVYKKVSSWSGTMVALLIVALWWGVNVLPRASYWLEPHTMVVADFATGEDATLLVYRDIHRPVFAEWSATIRKFDNDGWAVYCAATGSSRYKPDSVLPEPLTLSWWFNNQCSVDDPGQYYITTNWTLFPDWAAGRRMTRPLISNVFEVRDCDSGPSPQRHHNGPLPCNER